MRFFSSHWELPAINGLSKRFSPLKPASVTFYFSRKLRKLFYACFCHFELFDTIGAHNFVNEAINGSMHENENGSTIFWSLGDEIQRLADDYTNSKVNNNTSISHRSRVRIQRKKNNWSDHNQRMENSGNTQIRNKILLQLLLFAFRLQNTEFARKTR